MTVTIEIAIGSAHVSENHIIGMRTHKATIEVIILFNIVSILSHSAKSSLPALEYLNGGIKVVSVKIRPELVGEI